MSIFDAMPATLPDSTNDNPVNVPIVVATGDPFSVLDNVNDVPLDCAII